MGQPRILYVEDNVDNRTLVRRILMAEDFEIMEAPNGFEALEMAREKRPDLILMDINLPEIDGYEWTERFKSTPGFEEIPIIALTANVMKGDREKTLAAGCDGYIQKPVDVDQVPDQIRSFLKGA